MRIASMMGKRVPILSDVKSTSDFAAVYSGGVFGPNFADRINGRWTLIQGIVVITSLQLCL